MVFLYYILAWLIVGVIFAFAIDFCHGDDAKLHGMIKTDLSGFLFIVVIMSLVWPLVVVFVISEN